MKHFTSPSFWNCYQKLPEEIKSTADKNFALLKENPHHPSLHTKKVGEFWTVRVGRRYRALSIEVEQGILWFWVGTHSEYDKIIG